MVILIEIESIRKISFYNITNQCLNFCWKEYLYSVFNRISNIIMFAVIIVVYPLKCIFSTLEEQNSNKLLVFRYVYNSIS